MRKCPASLTIDFDGLTCTLEEDHAGPHRDRGGAGGGFVWMDADTYDEFIIGGVCGRVRPGTLGYQRCWRIAEHEGPHVSQDRGAWVVLEPAVSGQGGAITLEWFTYADERERAAETQFQDERTNDERP